jgi:hypothetical protein
MECSLNAFFRCSSGSNGPRKPLHDECDRVAVTLHVVGCGAGANFDRHLGCRHQGSRTPREEYALCATRRRSQTLTTREEESFIRLLNPRCGMDRTGSLTYPADCLYNLTISTPSTISISSPTMVRPQFDLEIVRLIFVVASARRLFWHTQIDETSLDQICGLNLDEGDLNAEFFERRNR